VFARLANGSATPVRAISGQAAKLSRSVHGIAFDEARDEIAITNPLAEAVLFFRGDADGEAAPVRIIQGPKTHLSRQFGTLDTLAVDPQNGDVYVPLKGRRGAVLVFPHGASGDVAPSRILMGPKTQLGSPHRLAIDPINNLLVIARRGERGGAGQTPAILIFDRNADSDTAPKAVIAGPKTDLIEPNGLTVDPVGRRIFVASTESTEGWAAALERGQEQRPGFIGVWSYEHTGDVAPLAVLRGPNSTLIRPRGVAVDPRYRELYVVDMVQTALLTFALPDLFGTNDPQK
jgi:DNA-binding beta-propeller fold protein YncE